MTGIIFKLTTAGRAALVNAAHDGTNARRVVSVGITATAFTPTEELATIPGEIKRITTIAGDVVASDTIHVTIRDDGADSYTVRGLGLYLDNGVLLGTYSQAAVILEKSPASIFLLATDVRVLDGSVDISTLQFGETNFINPPATTERQGVVQLATKVIAEALTDATRALTAASVAGLFAARALVTRKISAGTGLEGGGNLEDDCTLSVKFGTAANTVAMGNHSHSSVTQAANGLMSAADKKKLDGIAENANNYSLPAATSAALGGIKLGHATVQTVATSNPTATADRTYAVQVNSAGLAVVNVPWANTNTTYGAVTQTVNGLMSAADKKKLDGIAENANNYSLPAATSAALGGIKLGHATVQTVAASNPTATAARSYPVQVNSAGQAVVNVPWVDTNTNTTYGAVTQTVNGLMIAADKKKLDGIEEGANNYSLTAATAVALGGIKLGHATVQTVAAANPTATAARTYPVQVNSAGQAVVNVPWVDTNTNTTYGAATTSAAGLVELATTAETVTGTDTMRAVTPAGVKAAMNADIAPLQARVSGAESAINTINNRKWADVSADRLINTLYQNLWGYPIAISVTTKNAGALLEVSADSVNWIRLGKDGAERSQFYGDIPDRWWYRIIGGGSVDIWSQFA